MGLRETLNQNPRVTTGVTIGLLGIALIWAVWHLWPSSATATLKTQAWYTEDDGATRFADEEYKVSPFPGPQGGEAVRIRVFQSDKNRRSPMVDGWLEKFDETAKAALEEFYKNPKNKDKEAPQWKEFEEKNVLVKKPGAKAWMHVVKNAAQAKTIRTVKMPDGGQPVEFKPQVPVDE